MTATLCAVGTTQKKMAAFMECTNDHLASGETASNTEEDGAACAPERANLPKVQQRSIPEKEVHHHAEHRRDQTRHDGTRSAAFPTRSEEEEYARHGVMGNSGGGAPSRAIHDPQATSRDANPKAEDPSPSAAASPPQEPAAEEKKNESDNVAAQSSSFLGQRNEEDARLSPTENVEDAGTITLVKKIGQGSCGAVYIGRHTHSSRDYAVKVVSRSADYERWVRLLKRARLESELLESFDHPNIVRGFGLLETGDYAALLMEHARGGDLLEFLNREGALDEDRARIMFRQMIKAVQQLHRRGWVHRDIKPENIFLAFDEDDDEESADDTHAREEAGEHDTGETVAQMDQRHNNKNGSAADRRIRATNVRLMLGDFGFARRWHPDKRMQECVGTLPYTAPEVIQKKKYIGPEIDVWSLGVVLVAMLTAKMPFAAATPEISASLAAAGVFTLPPGASQDVYDLLTSILQPIPSLRVTLDELWGHPWLQTGQATWEDSDDEDNEARERNQDATNGTEASESPSLHQNAQVQKTHTLPANAPVQQTVESPKKLSPLQRAANLIFRRTKRSRSRSKADDPTQAAAAKD